MIPLFHPSNKFNYNLDCASLKVDLLHPLFQSLEMTGLVHERKNVFSIFILNQVDRSRILRNLPEMGVI
jgi:hypothetical protein